MARPDFPTGHCLTQFSIFFFESADSLPQSRGIFRSNKLTVDTLRNLENHDALGRILKKEVLAQSDISCLRCRAPNIF